MSPFPSQTLSSSSAYKANEIMNSCCGTFQTNSNRSPVSVVMRLVIAVRVGPSRLLGSLLLRRVEPQPALCLSCHRSNQNQPLGVELNRPLTFLPSNEHCLSKKLHSRALWEFLGKTMRVLSQFTGRFNSTFGGWFQVTADI